MICIWAATKRKAEKHQPRRNSITISTNIANMIGQTPPDKWNFCTCQPKGPNTMRKSTDQVCFELMMYWHSVHTLQSTNQSRGGTRKVQVKRVNQVISSGRTNQLNTVRSRKEKNQQIVVLNISTDM
jgi:hypothetical protein